MKDDNTTIVITPGTISMFFIIGILFALAWYMMDILLVILTSVVIASAIEPGARFFEEKRIPRVLGVLLIYASVIVLSALLFVFFFPILLDDTVRLLNNIPEYSNSLAVWNPLGNIGLSQINELFSLKQILQSLSSSLSNFTASFFGTVSGLFGGLLSLLLIIVLSFYLAVQKDGVGDFLRIVIPLKYEGYVIGLWRRSQHKIGLWLQGQLLLGVIVGVLTYLGLAILGVENALFLAVIAGVTELIPVFGMVMAFIPAVAVAYFQEGTTLALLVAGLYLIIQQFESHLIYPLVVKKIIGIPPILTIIMLLVGAKLAGFLGVMLSVPLAAVLVEVLSDIEKKKHPKIIN